MAYKLGNQILRGNAAQNALKKYNKQNKTPCEAGMPLLINSTLNIT